MIRDAFITAFIRLCCSRDGVGIDTKRVPRMEFRRVPAGKDVNCLLTDEEGKRVIFWANKNDVNWPEARRRYPELAEYWENILAIANPVIGLSDVVVVPIRGEENAIVHSGS